MQFEIVQTIDKDRVAITSRDITLEIILNYKFLSECNEVVMATPNEGENMHKILETRTEK